MSNLVHNEHVKLSSHFFTGLGVWFVLIAIIAHGIWRIGRLG
jgi:hypothetical protein